MRAWDYLAAEPMAVKFHLFTVLPAFILGTWLLLASRKGSRSHRIVGAIYLLLMSITAVATLSVRSINPPHLSIVHLFVPLTLVSVISAFWAIRRGNIRLHRNAMIGLYIGGLLIAGAFTFSPGRLLYRMTFG